MTSVNTLVITTIPNPIPNGGGTYKMIVKDNPIYKYFENSPTTLTSTYVPNVYFYPNQDVYDVVIPANGGSARTVVINGINYQGNQIFLFSGLQS